MMRRMRSGKNQGKRSTSNHREAIPAVSLTTAQRISDTPDPPMADVWTCRISMKAPSAEIDNSNPGVELELNDKAWANLFTQASETLEAPSSPSRTFSRQNENCPPALSSDRKEFAPKYRRRWSRSAKSESASVASAATATSGKSGASLSSAATIRRANKRRPFGFLRFKKEHKDSISEEAVRQELSPFEPFPETLPEMHSQLFEPKAVLAETESEETEEKEAPDSPIDSSTEMDVKVKEENLVTTSRPAPLNSHMGTSSKEGFRREMSPSPINLLLKLEKVGGKEDTSVPTEIGCVGRGAHPTSPTTVPSEASTMNVCDLSKSSASSTCETLHAQKPGKKSPPLRLASPLRKTTSLLNREESPKTSHFSLIGRSRSLSPHARVGATLSDARIHVKQPLRMNEVYSSDLFGEQGQEIDLADFNQIIALQSFEKAGKRGRKEPRKLAQSRPSMLPKIVTKSTTAPTTLEQPTHEQNDSVEACQSAAAALCSETGRDKSLYSDVRPDQSSSASDSFGTSLLANRNRETRAQEVSYQSNAKSRVCVKSVQEEMEVEVARVGRETDEAPLNKTEAKKMAAEATEAHGLLISDLPGVVSKIVREPGRKEAADEVKVETKQEERLHAAVKKLGSGRITVMMGAEEKNVGKTVSEKDTMTARFAMNASTGIVKECNSETAIEEQCDMPSDVRTNKKLLSDCLIEANDRNDLHVYVDGSPTALRTHSLAKGRPVSALSHRVSSDLLIDQMARLNPTKDLVGCAGPLKKQEKLCMTRPEDRSSQTVLPDAQRSLDAKPQGEREGVGTIPAESKASLTPLPPRQSTQVINGETLIPEKMHRQDEFRMEPHPLLTSHQKMQRELLLKVLENRERMLQDVDFEAHLREGKPGVDSKHISSEISGSDFAMTPSPTTAVETSSSWARSFGPLTFGGNQTEGKGDGSILSSPQENSNVVVSKTASDLGSIGKLVNEDTIHVSTARPIVEDDDTSRITRNPSLDPTTVPSDIANALAVRGTAMPKVTDIASLDVVNTGSKEPTNVSINTMTVGATIDRTSSSFDFLTGLSYPGTDILSSNNDASSLAAESCQSERYVGRRAKSFDDDSVAFAWEDLETTPSTVPKNADDSAFGLARAMAAQLVSVFSGEEYQDETDMSSAYDDHTEYFSTGDSFDSQSLKSFMHRITKIRGERIHESGAISPELIPPPSVHPIHESGAISPELIPPPSVHPLLLGKCRSESLGSLNQHSLSCLVDEEKEHDNSSRQSSFADLGTASSQPQKDMSSVYCNSSNTGEKNLVFDSPEFVRLTESQNERSLVVEIDNDDGLTSSTTCETLSSLFCTISL